MTIASSRHALIRHELCGRSEQFLLNFTAVHPVRWAKSQETLLLAFTVTPNASDYEFKWGRWLVAFLGPFRARLDDVTRSRTLLANITPAVLSARCTRSSGPLSCSSNMTTESDSLINAKYSSLRAYAQGECSRWKQPELTRILIEIAMPGPVACCFSNVAIRIRNVSV